MSWTDYLESKVLDHIFRGIPYPPPTRIDVVLFQTIPNEAGVGTEVPVGKYTRQPVTFGAQTTPGRIPNDAVVSFTMPAGPVSAIGLADQDGNLLTVKALNPARTYVEDEPVTIAVGDLIQTVD